MIQGSFLRKAGTSLLWLIVGYGARQVADPWLDAVKERIPLLAEQHTARSAPYVGPRLDATRLDLYSSLPLQGPAPPREIPELLMEARYVP